MEVEMSFLTWPPELHLSLSQYPTGCASQPAHVGEGYRGHGHVVAGAHGGHPGG